MWKKNTTRREPKETGVKRKPQKWKSPKTCGGETTREKVKKDTNVKQTSGKKKRKKLIIKMLELGNAIGLGSVLDEFL